jgi:regulator of protease activity HflC (stomatin/prohibitin superfamily)
MSPGVSRFNDSTQKEMEQSKQKNGLVNLALALVIFLAGFGVTVFAGSLGGQVASVFLGLAVLVTFASWFQMRLEENERLERLEMDDLARSRGASLFEAKDAGSFPARNAREQFEKYFVPGFAILLLLLEGAAAWLLWRWSGKNPATLKLANATVALSLFAIFALLLFLFGRFSVTMARLENHRLLRPGASFLLAGAYVCAVTALGIAGAESQYPRADYWVACGLCVLLVLMAVESLLTLLLEMYRPRVKGKVARPLYDGRVVGILAQPESLFATAAQTLDYQFGFKVSETWFFKAVQKNLLTLVLLQLAVLIVSTSFVFVNAGEQAVLEHFGRPVAFLDPGAHLKLPWPADRVYRYRTDQIQSLYVGYSPDTNETSMVLWTVAHNKEQNFLVGTTEPTALKTDNSETNNALKTPPVSLISISIPVQFQITNVYDWAYKNADPAGLLESVATRAVVHYLAGADLNDILSHGRLEAAQVLAQKIQESANHLGLGAKIVFVGLEDVHPPTASQVAATYEKVIGAKQTRIATNLNAQAEAIMTNALADALAFSTNSAAEAFRVRLETSAFASAALFTNQLPAYEAAPSIYKQRAYFKAFPEATANARKYVLLVTNTQNVFIYELEDKIRADLENLTVPK